MAFGSRSKEVRNILEKALEAGALKLPIFVGKDQDRLPNTLCFATPGWKGETQVMQMDLAGFCGQRGLGLFQWQGPRQRGVLRQWDMTRSRPPARYVCRWGHRPRKKNVLRFAEAWLEKEKKHRARAA